MHDVSYTSVGLSLSLLFFLPPSLVPAGPKLLDHLQPAVQAGGVYSTYVQMQMQTRLAVVAVCDGDIWALESAVCLLCQIYRRCHVAMCCVYQ
jgi:hypothetical protein